MKSLLLITILFLLYDSLIAQNVGIGTQTATEKLEVNGNIKASGLILPIGSPFDFLSKSAAGEVGFKKGHGAVAVTYIICISGTYPSAEVYTESPWLGEIKLFAGPHAPAGWSFCHGQLLSINQNQALFSLLLNNYGGNGQTTFALPDLRRAVPVSAGISPAGYQWTMGQKSN